MSKSIDVEVHPQFRYRLRELRQRAGLSLRALGTASNYSHSYIHDLEMGLKQPTADTAARLDAALAADGQLITLVTARLVVPVPTPSAVRGVRVGADVGVEFASDWRSGVEIATGLWRSTVQRRNVVRDAAFSVGAFVSPAMRWLTSPLDEQPVGDGDRLVGSPDVDTIRQFTATFRSLDNNYGGGHVHPTVVRFLDAEVAPLLRRGRFDPSVGAALLSATAEMTQLAAWTAYDCGMHGLAQRYLIQALRLAQAASDRALGAEILAAMSHQAAYLQAGQEAIDLARAADRAASDAGMEAVRAEAAVLEAHGHAVSGDERACAVALDRAEKTLDKADRAGDPQWIRYFDEAYLAAKFGHCFAALGRGDLAYRFAARSLDMDARYVRGKQFNLALLATAHAQTGDVEQAAVVGTQAVQAAEGLRSARSVDYLSALAERLASHVGLPVVREFADQVRPMLTAR